MLEFWSLVHSGTVALGSAKNDVSRWSRGLGRRYFYSPRRGGILTKQRTPLSSTPSNTMPHSGTNQQVRFCRPPPPYHRVASSRSVRVPALSIKVSRFRSDVPIRHASQGNSYSTPGGNNSREGSSYNYQNSNGSYYYANDNGSTYYKSSSGSSTYTSPSGNVTKK